jgi:DNA polymerase-1
MAGVGDKTAVAVLQGVGSIDTIAAHPERVAELSFRGAKTFAAKFKEQEAMVRLSQQLATIKTDVELPLSLAELRRHEVQKEALLALYRQFEFKNLVQELESLSEATVETVTPVDVTTQYDTILTEADLTRWLEKLQQVELFAFDIETNSLDYIQAQVVGLSFAVAPGEAAYLPLAHDYLGAPEQLDREQTLAILKPLLEDQTRLKVGQHLKFDRNVLRNHGIHLQGIAFDTMLESYVLNSTASRHNMDDLAKKYLNYTTQTFEDVAGKGVKQLTFNQVELEKAAFYAAEDADITLRLHQTLWPQVEKPFSQVLKE